MRFKIDFALLGEPPFTLPVNYQSEFASWIHKMLHFESEAFVDWLRQKGYLDNSGEYKLFTFSDLFFDGHKQQKGERYTIESAQAGFILSFYAEDEIEPFLIPIFEKKEFKIGDSKGKTAFKVKRISRINEMDISGTQNVTLKCISPMLIAEPGKSEGPFLSPDQKDFDKVLFKNLMFKYANLIKFMPSSGNGLLELKDLKFELIGKPKAKVVKIKTDTPHQKSVKGYIFDFRLKAPESLLSIGLEGGFGEHNHLGFGCCELKTE